MNHCTRIVSIVALGIGAFGCADERSPAVVPGPLMAAAPVPGPAAPAVDPATPAIDPPPADHPAYASAQATPEPSRVERAVGIEPVPEPAADAPPLRVDFARSRSSSLASSEPTMDADAPVPAGAGCAGGLRGLATEFPWGDGDGTWKGTGNPDPEPLKAISDEAMMALAADTGLDSPDREHALVSVGRRHLPGAMAAFRAGLDEKQPRGVREMSLSGLIEHGGPEALKLMWRALERDPAAQIRGMAVWAIALYGPDEALKAITTGLSDPTYDVQGMAILAVWALKDRPSVAMPILEAATKADEQRLWQEGLNVLARMPYSDAGNMLRDIANTTEGEKRNSAVLYYRMWRNTFPDLCK